MNAGPDRLGFEITGRDVYDLMLATKTSVDILLAQHGALAKDVADHEVAAQREQVDTEMRLRALERGRWPLPSLAALIAMASLAVAIITFVNK